MAGVACVGVAAVAGYTAAATAASGEAFGLGAVVAATPIGWVAAGIRLVCLGGLLLWKYW